MSQFWFCANNRAKSQPYILQHSIFVWRVVGWFCYCFIYSLNGYRGSLLIQYFCFSSIYINILFMFTTCYKIFVFYCTSVFFMSVYASIRLALRFYKSYAGKVYEIKAVQFIMHGDGKNSVLKFLLYVFLIIPNHKYI